MPFRIFTSLKSKLYAKSDEPSNLLKNRFKSNNLKVHLYFMYRQKPHGCKAKFAGSVKNCRPNCKGRAPLLTTTPMPDQTPVS